MKTAVTSPESANYRRPAEHSSFQRFSFQHFSFTQPPLFPRTPISPPSGPLQWLFQGPPAESKVLAATASGKSSIALQMARELDGGIVNADAFPRMKTLLETGSRRGVPTPREMQFLISSGRARSQWRGSLRMGLVFGVAFAFSICLSFGAQEAPKRYLSFQVGYVGKAKSIKDQKPGFETETDIEFGNLFSGEIEVRPESHADGVTWYPRGSNLKIVGRIAETSTKRANLLGEGGVTAVETTVDSFKGRVDSEASFGNAFVKIRAAERKYDLQFTLMPDMATTMDVVRYSREHRIRGAPSLGGGRIEEPAPTESVPLDMGPSQMGLQFSNSNMVVDIKGESLNAEPGVLTGLKRIPIPKPAGWNGAWNLALQVWWRIDVSLPPVELIVTSGEYETWRPETTPERGAGKPLEVTATLVTSSGGKPQTRIESFIWKLEDTSREPGVALNFPIDEFTDEPDLELDASGEMFVLSADKQRMDRTVREGWSDTVKVVPFDWGGWTTLQVTAVLADGRRVIGRVKGKKENDMLIPKRSSDSHIADGWKGTHKSGADDLDDEKIAGQKDDGDGYTLYEEYRGWVMDGKHVDGDVDGKDFFVLNLIGADAEPGIDLFESISQLRVHSKLLRSEMSEDSRVMNGNHTAGAHQKVDQHGVWIQQFVDDPKGTKDGKTGVEKLGDTGARTVLEKSDVAGRPGNTKGIGILARDNTESIFNQPFNLPAQDSIFTFDRAIAHELLHSVGVEHHGAGDYKMRVEYVSTRNRTNKLGRPYYEIERGKPIDLRTEQGVDVAQRDISEYEKFRKLYDGMFLENLLKDGAEYIKSNGVGFNGYHTPQDYADFQIEVVLISGLWKLSGLVGVEHGEHSGAEDCLMRYYFAKFYESKLPPVMGDKMYYLVAPGTERIGMEICRSGAGTGVNASSHKQQSSHKPQSRYGDAASDAGNCFEQICPNDSILPRKTK